MGVNSPGEQLSGARGLLFAQTDRCEWAWCRITPYRGSGRLTQASAVSDRKSKDLQAEATQATELLTGKVVASVSRDRESEVLIEFTDGSRLFVDAETPVALSIT